MKLEGKKTVVVGLGRSGVAAARLLLAHGASVVGVDGAERERLSPEALALEALGVRLDLGAHRASSFQGAELVVVSPGVPSFPELESFEAAGGEVIGELELGSRFVEGPLVLIGGTNGKSTTTALVAAIFEASGKKVFLGGNFGTPLCEACVSGAERGGRPQVHRPDFEVYVVEISSFQAERVPTLHARAHALLNVTDDHLDRYPSFDAYARAKGNPFERMGAEDFAVVPEADATCLRQARRGQAALRTFSLSGSSASLGLETGPGGEALVDRVHGERYPLEAVRLRGRHNLENACAAIALTRALGVPTEAIRSALASFEGLAHRCVRVASSRGVAFYDDSKGTNVGAAVAALRGLAEPKAVLIAGGKDKLGAYEPLVEALRERGRALVVLGEAAERIAAAAEGVLPIERASTMEEAVRRAASFAQSGDAVLLSPACASFDMFRDYKHRGDVFTAAAKALQAEQEAGT